MWETVRLVTLPWVGREDCPVCLEGYMEGQRGAMAACAHRFHESCMRDWIDSRTDCPECCRLVRTAVAGDE